MNISERIVSIFAPQHCVGCGVERDRLICEMCTAALSRVPSRCYRCRSTTKAFSVCERCRKSTPLTRVVIGTSYDGIAKQLLHAAKYERARSGLVEIGSFLVDPVQMYLERTALLVHVPTASTRVRQRGYDQAEEMARTIGSLVGMPWATLLVRRSQEHQVGSNRSERIKHVKQAFRLSHRSRIRGAHIVLVDDVLTTGATLEEAARALKKAGAAQVDAVVFCQPDHQ